MRFCKGKVFGTNARLVTAVLMAATLMACSRKSADNEAPQVHKVEATAAATPAPPVPPPVKMRTVEWKYDGTNKYVGSSDAERRAKVETQSSWYDWACQFDDACVDSPVSWHVRTGPLVENRWPLLVSAEQAVDALVPPELIEKARELQREKVVKITGTVNGRRGQVTVTGIEAVPEAEKEKVVLETIASAYRELCTDLMSPRQVRAHPERLRFYTLASVKVSIPENDDTSAVLQMVYSDKFVKCTIKGSVPWDLSYSSIEDGSYAPIYSKDANVVQLTAPRLEGLSPEAFIALSARIIMNSGYFNTVGISMCATQVDSTNDMVKKGLLSDPGYQWRVVAKSCVSEAWVACRSYPSTVVASDCDKLGRTPMN